MVEEETKEQETKKPEVKERFELVKVPLTEGTYVKDTKTDEVWEDKKVLVEILNKLQHIENKQD